MFYNTSDRRCPAGRLRPDCIFRLSDGSNWKVKQLNGIFLHSRSGTLKMKVSSSLNSLNSPTEFLMRVWEVMVGVNRMFFLLLPDLRCFWCFFSWEVSTRVLSCLRVDSSRSISMGIHFEWDGPFFLDVTLNWVMHRFPELMDKTGWPKLVDEVDELCFMPETFVHVVSVDSSSSSLVPAGYLLHLSFSHPRCCLRVRSRIVVNFQIRVPSPLSFSFSLSIRRVQRGKLPTSICGRDSPILLRTCRS